ncbi:hypothetical protein [Actinomycetospora soli]|uniref:hypothetical protein n=1 Tax=Actinomycetospora soli TaxID=2893887 RepID=UPI001E4D259E|nr:hypothetical protein [Actinomycetospora soli]MCD2186814.1 hypothetical protein [Actinomycetospora soli]
MDTSRPFRHADLIASGAFTRHHVVDGRFTSLFPGVSVGRDTVVTMAVRAAGAALLHPRAVVLGTAAAALWGSPDDPLDVTVDLAVGPGGRRSCPGVRLHRLDLPPEELTEHRGGLRSSTPARAAYDLARWLPRGEAVVALDALTRRTGLAPDDVRAVAAAHRGDREVRAVEPVLAWVDPRSPDDEASRRRVRLLARGLPVPVVEQRLLDTDGGLVARLALAWPEARVGLGGDRDGWARARAIGWEVIRPGARVAADDVVRWVSRAYERWDPEPRLGMPRPLRLPPPPEPDGTCDGGLSRLVADSRE